MDFLEILYIGGIFFCVGLLFIPGMKRFIIPKLNAWLEKLIENWNLTEIPKQEPKACSECGSTRRHKLTCSKRKK